MRRNKTITLALAVTLAVGALGACSSSNDTPGSVSNAKRTSVSATPTEENDTATDSTPTTTTKAPEATTEQVHKRAIECINKMTDVNNADAYGKIKIDCWYSTGTNLEKVYVMRSYGKLSQKNTEIRKLDDTHHYSLTINDRKGKMIGAIEFLYDTDISSMLLQQTMYSDWVEKTRNKEFEQKALLLEAKQ